MRFLLDTNVVSELRKPQPNPKVSRWTAETHEENLFLSVVTVAELRFGIERQENSEHRNRLEEWVRNVIEGFGVRVLPIDTQVAEAWGNIMARSAAVGRKMAPMDCFLAATALVWDLTLVTRNTADFSHFGGSVFSPWDTTS